MFNQLNRKLARWAFRACTSADLKLPSFALADDGVLIEHRGKILSASDWIPEGSSITSLTAEEGLCVRYPIRMQEDLLPIRHLTNEELVPALKQALGTADLDETLVATILERQLRMEGTYILHSKTASKNGGDFDFDTICVMPSDQFPKFVAGRIAYEHKFSQEKTKQLAVVQRTVADLNQQLTALQKQVGEVTGKLEVPQKLQEAKKPELAKAESEFAAASKPIALLHISRVQTKW